MRKILVLLLFLVVLSSVNAKQGHLKLLAVSSAGDKYVGSIADLYLEIRPGNGGVFIETFPLTKIDTQISTRFAKEIACKYLDIDCTNNDFFYTIRAGSSIIGGPSAGGAVAVLTVAVLDDLNVNETIAMTGTINSGGAIGPVAGVKEKIMAASKNNIKKVLIPKIETIFPEEEKTNMSAFASGLGIKVVAVSDLDQAMYEFTGKTYAKEDAELKPSETYVKTMKKLSRDLCERNNRLREQILKYNLNESMKNSLAKIDNTSLTGELSHNQSRYYSSASFCFGSNVGYKHILLKLQNMDTDEIIKYAMNVKKIVVESSKRLEEKKYKTLTDLEAFVVVKERLMEANDFADNTVKSIVLNDTDSALYNLAYAQERVYSASSWSEFFDKKGKEFELNEEVVRKSCLNKISEVEERFQYMELFVPIDMFETRKELRRAYNDMDEENYELCLFKAAKAKAELDSVLTVMGVTKKNINQVLEQKLDIARKNIIRESKKGIFPILGYSYFEYADSLKDKDPYSSMLYAEYALELSDLDLYFKEKKKIKTAVIDIVPVLFFASGLLFGIYFGILLARKKPKKRK